MSLPTSESPASHLDSASRLLSPSNNDYDGDDISSTTSSLRKPFDEFQRDEYSGRKGCWWTLGMPLRARRTGRRGNGQVKEDELDSLYSRRKAKRRSWFNYCIFGGISGLSILYVFLSPSNSPSLSPSTLFIANTHLQSIPPPNKPLPSPPNPPLDSLPRPRPLPLGQTAHRHRRPVLVPDRFHARCLTDSVPFP